MWQVSGHLSVQSATKRSSTNITWPSMAACTAERNRSDVNIASRRSVILAPFHSTWRTSTSTASHRRLSSRSRCWWWHPCQQQLQQQQQQQLAAVLSLAVMDTMVPTCLQVQSPSTSSLAQPQCPLALSLSLGVCNVSSYCCCLLHCTPLTHIWRCQWQYFHHQILPVSLFACVFDYYL